MLVRVASCVAMIRPPTALAVAGLTLVFAARAALAQAPPAATLAVGATPASDSSAVVIAAGDIAACTFGASETARLLDNLPGTIIVVGDAAYPSRRDPNPYKTCYDSTWGRHKERTRPVPGNHDVLPRSVMRMYFNYFGEAAGQEPDGYYSFDVGRWHVLGLNSTIAMGPKSKQGKWVAADLEANQAKCTLAFMHHPRFSSGPHSKAFTTRDVFPLLVKGGVDIVISAHDHIYERFSPMRADGSLDKTGVRQFVVGTGGNMLYPVQGIEPHSEISSNEAHGVLKLTLHPSSYAWEFVPVEGGTFRDVGRSECH
jgi:hypothetical protein